MIISKGMSILKEILGMFRTYDRCINTYTCRFVRFYSYSGVKKLRSSSEIRWFASWLHVLIKQTATFVLHSSQLATAPTMLVSALVGMSNPSKFSTDLNGVVTPLEISIVERTVMIPTGSIHPTEMSA